ncbi:metal-dependent hydrolase [Pontibacter anaerobius]|uniref:Metal-dependent hydrolase n=1 Tax=Pontibacter anaerobius TaxID=2993940 RepID=A0ABT3RC06_9BACT|nr:metal-dependent hydrolase [Pontibacter anaerobius]MCX2739382.1 metal-dependent hydrolase [Pontibacter anaerobius]
MDSLTQIVLGASVGEAVAGKKLGNKAMLWGAIAGTIPDLDVLMNPWLSPVQQLSFHRSLTHSFLFAVVMSPILGWLLHRLYKNATATTRDWTLLFFLGFVTHILLDSCTTWGTQLFWPFSNYGVAFYNVFVVDPAYTLPFLVLVATAAFYNRLSPKRQFLNYAGLAISSAYLLWSFIGKSMANRVFEQSMSRQDIRYTSYISKPTPMNTVFWSVTAEGEDGFYNGFYSLLDENQEITYDYEPANKELLAPYRGHPELERLLQLTKGYYTVEKTDDGALLINDLRFGKFDGWKKSGGGYVFVYKVWQDKQGNLQFEEINNRPKVDGEYLMSYWSRIKGQP